MNKVAIGAALIILGIVLIFAGFTGRTISTIAGLVHGEGVLVEV